MQAATTNTGEPNDYGQLLLLQEVRNADSRVVQYFVCNDCLDLVEKEGGINTRSRLSSDDPTKE